MIRGISGEPISMVIIFWAILNPFPRCIRFVSNFSLSVDGFTVTLNGKCDVEIVSIIFDLTVLLESIIGD